MRGGCGAGSHAPSYGQEEGVIDVDLRVISYNVRYFGHPQQGFRATSAGVRRVAEAIGTLNPLPDVICLQEVEARSWRSGASLDGEDRTQLDAFSAALDLVLRARRREERFRAYYFPAHRYTWGSVTLYTTGLAILVQGRLPVVAQTQTDITHRRFRATAGVKQTRVCGHLRIDTPRGQVDVFNTHLSLPSFLSLDVMQMGFGQNQQVEVQRLAAAVRTQATSTRFMVMGDFNSVPGSPVYHQALRTLEAVDAFSESRGLTVAKLGGWPTYGVLTARFRLDHVLRGAGLRAVESEGVEPFGAPGRWKGLSDHVPVLVGFQIV